MAGSILDEAIEAVGAVRNQEIGDMLVAKDILAADVAADVAVEELTEGVSKVCLASGEQPWIFHKHIAGTSYHKVSFTANRKQISSWIKFWEHITGKERPIYCPGTCNGCNEAHLIGGKRNACVGAHVILKRQNEQGEKEFMFAVIPACKVCNNVRKENELVWECTAVPILNFQTLQFVGNIYVPSTTFINSTRLNSTNVKILQDLANERPDCNITIPDDETQLADYAKSLLTYYKENGLEIPEGLVGGYWKQITGITTEGNANKKTIIIKGLLSSSSDATYTYEDPDAFLQALALLYKMKSTINREEPPKRTTTDSKNFVAESVIVNKGNYPTNCEAYKNNSVETANASDSDTGVGVGESKEDSS